jgi:hypothetical protein
LARIRCCGILKLIRLLATQVSWVHPSQVHCSQHHRFTPSISTVMVPLSRVRLYLVPRAERQRCLPPTVDRCRHPVPTDQVRLQTLMLFHGTTNACTTDQSVGYQFKPSCPVCCGGVFGLRLQPVSWLESHAHPSVSYRVEHRLQVQRLRALRRDRSPPFFKRCNASSRVQSIYATVR